MNEVPNFNALCNGIKVYHDSMRNMVKSVLIGNNPNDWWKNGVISSLPEKVKTDLELNVKKHPEQKNIDFIEAKHLVYIISKNRVFNKIFPDPQWTKAQMEMVAVACNKSKHGPSGDLPEEDVKQYLISIRKLLEAAKLPEAEKIATYIKDIDDTKPLQIRNNIMSHTQKLDEDSKAIKILNQDDAALAFIYIAQNARSDGPKCAGVLVECAGEPVDDCNQYFQGIHRLLIQGAIQEKNWYKLRGYVTTAEGSRRASLIIQQRLDRAKDTLQNMFNSLPAKFAQFFRDEVMSEEVGFDYRRISRINAQGICPNSYVHVCLLKDDRVRKMLDKVITTLIHDGVVEIAHSYSSTNRGRVDDPVYSFAPEVATFLSKYLLVAGKLSVQPLFDNNLETKHQLYHLLTDGLLANKNYLDSKTLEHLRAFQGALRDDLRVVFYHLYNIHAITVDPSRVFIKNAEVFSDIVRQGFLSPLVDYMLSSTGQLAPNINSINENELKRVDQVDLLFGGSEQE